MPLASRPARPPTTLILATGNPHKVDELRAIFAPSGMRVLSLADFGGGSKFIEPAEIGRTFEENCGIKAISYARQLAKHAPQDALCLADDSGLEIDALNGAPGVISSHYSTAGRETGLSRPERDAANNARVLRELEGVRPEDRTARFVCVMAAAQVGHGEVLHTSRGTFEGRIGIPPRVPSGANGFGYDPLFLVAPEFTRTGAELPPGEKNRLSHRAKAAAAMSAWLCTAAGLK